MADEVPDFLRVSFARLNERLDRIEADMAEFRERLGHIEGQIAGIYGMYATISSRMDRMDRRLERIERRLDLVDTQSSLPQGRSILVPRGRPPRGHLSVSSSALASFRSGVSKPSVNQS